MARNGVIDSDAGMGFPFLGRLLSVRPAISSRDIAGSRNLLKKNGADSGEIRRSKPRGRSKVA